LSCFDSSKNHSKFHVMIEKAGNRFGVDGSFPSATPAAVHKNTSQEEMIKKMAEGNFTENVASKWEWILDRVSIAFEAVL